jgi:uncharacterized protein
MLITVEIASFAIHAEKNIPLIILKEAGGERTVVIPIFAQEANAIAIKSLNVSSKKVITVDLVKNVMDSLDGTLDKVVIVDDGGEFSARLHIFSRAGINVIECGCGDGIALSMRCNAPILIDESMFSSDRDNDTVSEKSLLRTNISTTDTIEFGKYYL